MSNEDQDYSAEPEKNIDPDAVGPSKEPTAEENKTEDELAPGPAERRDPGNESPATTASVE